MNSRDELVAALYGRCDHEDFDGLLEESSLGTAAARKNQAETPIEIYQLVQDHLRGSEVACRQGDVDDFLLHLVRMYSVSNDTEPTSSALVNTALFTIFWMFRHGFRWCRDTSEMFPSSVLPNSSERQERPSWNVADFTEFACHVRADLVPDIVQNLLDKGVFSYLRQDVARSMVSLCFNSRTSLPLAILNACASAVPASSFRDELADAFMNRMPTERTALTAGSWLKRLDEQDTIYPAGLWARRQTQQTLVITLKKWVDVTMQLPRPQDQTNVSDLLQRACEPAVWEEILRRYGKLVSSTVRSFRLQEVDALDAVQMTWLRVAENCHRIQSPERLGGWLATTASRECLRILRHQAQQTPTPHDTVAQQVADPSVGPEQQAVDADTEQRLWDLVATLSPRRQTLLREMFVNNLQPYAEVVRNTEIPADAIGPARARALTQLRRRLVERLRQQTRDGLPESVAETCRELIVLQDHDDEIREEAWSPEVKWLTTVFNDCTLRTTPGIVVWDAASGSALAVLRGHDGAVREATEDDNELRRQVSERFARLLS